MSFADQIQSFTVKVDRVPRETFVDVATEAHHSIQDGSALTGAPGQPVETGALRNSWQLVFDSPTQATIGTNLVYAPIIETGVGPHGPITIRSQVGGIRSVALTIAGLPRIVEAMIAKRKGGA